MTQKEVPARRGTRAMAGVLVDVDVAEAMERHGYVYYHTGGNCTAWVKHIDDDDPRTLYITDGNRRAPVSGTEEVELEIDYERTEETEKLGYTTLALLIEHLDEEARA